MATAQEVELHFETRPSLGAPSIALIERLGGLATGKAREKFAADGITPFGFELPELNIAVDVTVAAVRPPGSSTIRHGRTRIVARPVAAGKMKDPNSLPEYFMEERTYPDPASGDRFDFLVGLDDVKDGVLAALEVFFGDAFNRWSEAYFKDDQPLISRQIGNGHPLIILEGIPGVGKSELALTVGDPLARRLKQDVRLLRMSLAVRGTGRVGELSANLRKAFAVAQEKSGEHQCPVLLLIDEADTLAQSREKEQQHHEDEAGVNTLLQEMDNLEGSRSVATILTTNRPLALDAALVRRGKAQEFSFPLPNQANRMKLFQRLLCPVVQEAELREAAARTERFTPGDIHQVCRRVALRAFSAGSFSAGLLAAVLAEVSPTSWRPEGQRPGEAVRMWAAIADRFLR